jgi:vitamin B12 transporter
MNRPIPYYVLALACAASPFALSNDRLEEVIVTSSRVEMPLRHIGTSVSAISGSEIRQRGFNSLFEVLRSQPAIAASNTGGPGKATALRIRGEEGYRTRIYLDGIDISDTSGTQFGPRVEHLLSSGVNRVEILRGPQGLMYGADAGGVVNISTESPASGLTGDVSAEGGRYGTRQLAGNLRGGNESLDFNLSLTDFETDGFNSRTTDHLTQDDDGYENTTVHARLGWNASDALRFQLVVRDVSAENEYDSCFTVDTFAPTNDCDDDFDQTAWRVQGSYDVGAFTNELSYNNSETDREFFSAGRTTYDPEGELERLSYVGSFSTSDALRLVYGVDLENSSLDDGTFDVDRDQDGYFAEYQGGFGDAFFVTAGLRYDDNEDFGEHTSYRVSGAYLFGLGGGELKLKGTWGTGFRAPSLSEIAYNNRPFPFPSAPEEPLDEEESEGYDLGVVWYAPSGAVLEVIYFDQTISDEIYFDLDELTGYLQDNGDTESTGVEVIGELPLFDSFLLSGNYTYNDTEDAEGNQRVRRPEHLANVGLNWRGLDDRLTLGLHLRASYDAVDSDGSDLDDYEVLDVNASYELFRGLEVFGRVENLLDEDYEEVPTYNTGGAAGYAGLRYSF